jgi:hypothetical protein
MPTDSTRTIADPSSASFDPGPIPPSGVDSHGRLLPISEEEQRARAVAIAMAFEAMADITDEHDTEEAWAEIERGIDATRPHRKLFEGRS